MSQFMRLVLMYDLEMTSPERVKEYAKFHKWIISKGYVMMQFSVYMKPINVPTKKDYEIRAVAKRLPGNGNIRVLAITDRQYNDMVYLRGGKRINETINTEAKRIKIKKGVEEDFGT